MSTRGTHNKAKGQQSTVKKKKTESEPKKDVKRLESDLEKAKKENESLKKELKECRFDLVTLQKNFNYEEVRKALPMVMDNDGYQAEQCARLTDEINKLQKEVEELKKKTGEEVRKALPKVMDNDGFQAEQCARLTDEINKLQKEVEELQKNTGMKELQAENEKLKTKLKEYENDMTRNLTDENVQLKSDNNELQKNIAIAEKSPLKIEQSEQKAVTQLEEERNQLEESRNQVERELNEANDEIKRLTSQLADSKNSNDKESSIKELTESKKQVATLKSKLEATEKLHQNGKEDKERELTESKKEVATLKSKLEAMEKLHQNGKEDKERELTETKEQLKDLKSSFQKMEQSYGDEKREKERELTESKKEVATLKSKLEAMEKSHQNGKGDKERELTETKEQLKDVKFRFEKMEQSYEDAKREKERLQEKMLKKQTGTEREKELLADIENLKTRLSELASAQLMTNNPNVTDLSDSNRPTKLAEQYSELYDNEWTNAYEFLEKTGLSEVEITQNLCGILLNSFKFCTDVSKEQTKQLKLALTTVPRVKNGEPISDDSIIPTKLRQLRELRKAFAPDMIDDVFQSYKKEEKPKDIDKVQVRDYTHKCITLSWFMSVQDPPVVIDTKNHTGNFDSDIFRTYTKTGALIDHVVWPPLYLHDGGPILCKGVAQAK